MITTESPLCDCTWTYPHHYKRMTSNRHLFTPRIIWTTEKIIHGQPQDSSTDGTAASMSRSWATTRSNGTTRAVIPPPRARRWARGCAACPLPCPAGSPPPAPRNTPQVRTSSHWWHRRRAHVWVLRCVVWWPIGRMWGVAPERSRDTWWCRDCEKSGQGKWVRLSGVQLGNLWPVTCAP